MHNEKKNKAFFLMSKINTVRFCLPEFARNRFKKKKKLSRKKSNFNRKRPRYKFVNSIKKIMLEKKNISPFFPVKNNSPNSGRIKKKNHCKKNYPAFI